MKIQIKVIRTIKKITQDELAERIGLMQSEISGIENGKRSPSLRTLERIARGLGCKVKDLIDENLDLNQFCGLNEPAAELVAKKIAV